MSGELLEAAGLVGGSKRACPRQPFVQPGNCRALASKLAEGCAGSNGFAASSDS